MGLYWVAAAVMAVAILILTGGLFATVIFSFVTFATLACTAIGVFNALRPNRERMSARIIDAVVSAFSVGELPSGHAILKAQFHASPLTAGKMVARSHLR